MDQTTPVSTDSPLVLAIDIGSSSVRANVFTSEARRLVELETRLPYKVNTTADGGVEISAEGLVARIFSAIDSTLSKAGELAGLIRGVGLCSLVSNVVGIDAEGRALTPLYTWADTRPSAQVYELGEGLDDEEVRERTGCPLHTSYLPARLLWLKQTMPEIYSRVDRWLSVGDLAYRRLFGVAQQSLSVASWTGLLNRSTMDWDSVMLQAIGLTVDRLPSLVDVDAPARGLKGDFAERWPALLDVPWFPCVGDGVTSNLGSGCFGPEYIAVQVGTSGAIRALIPDPVGRVPRGLWCYRLDRNSSLLGGALSEGGNLLDWLYHTLRVDDRAVVEHEAARMPPDSHGLTVLPFVAGERSPGWRGEARAVISGLSLDTGPAAIVRACQEAIAYRFALLYDLLREVLPTPRRIVASGGSLLGTEGWVQVLADVLGQVVTASGEAEASSRGTALIVLRSLGLLGNYGEVEAELGYTLTPDMGRHMAYRRGKERQVAMYRRLVG